MGARVACRPTSPSRSSRPRSTATSTAPDSTIGMDSAIRYARNRDLDELRITARFLPGARLPRPDPRRSARLPRRRGRRRRPALSTCWSPRREACIDAVPLAGVPGTWPRAGLAIAVMSEALAGDAVRIGEELAASLRRPRPPSAILGHAQRRALLLVHFMATGPRGGLAPPSDALARAHARLHRSSTTTGLVTPAPLGPPNTNQKEPSHQPRIRPTPLHPRLRPPDVLPDEAVRDRGAPSAEQRAQDGDRQADHPAGTADRRGECGAGTVGTLMDEEHGADAARAARKSGLVSAWRPRRARAPSSSSKTGTRSPSTSRRSTRTSSRSWSATTRRATAS